MSKKLFIPTYLLYGIQITEEQYNDEEFDYILDGTGWCLESFRATWEFLKDVNNGRFYLPSNILEQVDNFVTERYIIEPPQEIRLHYHNVLKFYIRHVLI